MLSALRALQWYIEHVVYSNYARNEILEVYADLHYSLTAILLSKAHLVVRVVCIELRDTLAPYILEHSLTKYCTLIGQSWVSKLLRSQQDF